MCRRLDDSEELMEEGRLAGLDGTIMQVMIKVVMVMKIMQVMIMVVMMKIMLMMDGAIMQVKMIVVGGGDDEDHVDDGRHHYAVLLGRNMHMNILI